MVRVEIPAALRGARLDRALAALLPELSRSRLQSLMRAGRVTVDGAPATPKTRVAGGERVVASVLEVAVDAHRAQPIPLRVLHEDDSILVIDKPAGMVVHPGAGNREGTLMNALLHRDPALCGLPRAGIVHRLDKDTSGVMVVARTESVRQYLIEALKRREVGRIYRAIVHGRVAGAGVVDAPLARQARNRLKMAVASRGRPARSRYRVLRRFAAHSYCEVRLETGRTHQIRVHMAHLGHPVVGDPLYGAAPRASAVRDEALREALSSLDRQLLHAWRLELLHPVSKRELSFDAALPAALAAVLDLLDRDRQRANPS